MQERGRRTAGTTTPAASLRAPGRSSRRSPAPAAAVGVTAGRPPRRLPSDRSASDRTPRGRRWSRPTAAGPRRARLRPHLVEPLLGQLQHVAPLAVERDALAGRRDARVRTSFGVRRRRCARGRAPRRPSATAPARGRRRGSARAGARTAGTPASARDRSTRGRATMPTAARGRCRPAARPAPARRRRSAPARCAPGCMRHARDSRRTAPPRSRRCAARGTARRPGARTRGRPRRPACPRVRSTASPGSAGTAAARSCGQVPRCAGDDEQPAAALDERVSRSATLDDTGTSLRTTTRAGLEIVGGQRLGVARDQRRSAAPRRPPARATGTGRRRARAGRSAMTVRTGRPATTMKWNTLSRVSASSASRTVARTSRRGQRDRRERGRARRVRRRR